MYGKALILARVFTVTLRVPKESAGLYHFMFAFSNTGFIGYPVMGAVLGTNSFVWVAIFNFPFSILVYSFGIFIISGSMGRFCLRDLLTPCFLTSVLSIVLGVFRLSLPGFLMDFCGLLGAMTTPCAMMIVGSVLASVALRDVFPSGVYMCWSSVSKSFFHSSCCSALTL